jgi:hypothetical protein
LHFWFRLFIVLVWRCLSLTIGSNSCQILDGQLLNEKQCDVGYKSKLNLSNRPMHLVSSKMDSITDIDSWKCLIYKAINQYGVSGYTQHAYLTSAIDRCTWILFLVVSTPRKKLPILAE